MQTLDRRGPGRGGNLRFLTTSADIRARALLVSLVLAAAGCGSRALEGAKSDGWVQPAVCKLPFEVGPCNALFSVFAYVNGACVARTYGGCDGNENQFATLEECLATCEGRPSQARACPSGRVSHDICVACGAAGGCAKTIAACAQPCGVEIACPQSTPFCIEGVCQVGGCI